MATVFVVLCTTDGCDRCSGRSTHIVGVAHNLTTAEILEREHETLETHPHLHHYYWTQVIEVELSAPAEWHLTQAQC